MDPALPDHLLGILSDTPWLVGEEDLILVGLPHRAVAEVIAALPPVRGFYSLTLDVWEVSLVLPADTWRGLAHHFPGARQAGPYRLLTFDAPLEPDLVGFLAAIAAALAARGIPIYALSAFSRDHVLVRAPDLPAAAAALAELRAEARRTLFSSAGCRCWHPYCAVSRCTNEWRGDAMPSESLTTFVSPGRYVQGRGAFGQAGRYLGHLGHKALVIWDRHVAGLVGDTLNTGLRDSGVEMTEAEFKGEVTAAEIDRLQVEARQRQAEVIVGVGGGKALDTAKAVGLPLGLAVAVLPTLASTDAPTSALAVLYDESGEFAEYRYYDRSPSLVLVDTAVIAQAPTRFLVSGMGDALATWFEARTTVHAHRTNIAGGLATGAALSLAHLCYQTLLEHGPAARLASQHKAITPAFERVVEANTLLSGLGFESGGLAAAHAIHNGLTVLRQMHEAYHGEKVAVGTVAQLVLEGRPEDEIHEVVDFCLEVGLPAGFNDLARSHISRDDLRRVAEAAVAPGETIHNEPMPVTAATVVDALLAADALAHARRQALGHLVRVGWAA